MKVTIEKKSKVTLYNIDETDTIELVILQASIANKSKLYFKYLNDILDTDTNKKWFFNIIKKFNLTQDHDLIYNEFLDRAIKIGQSYTTKMSNIIDMGSFVNRKKKTSNSIFFNEEEVTQFYTLSAVMKLYAIFCGTNIVDDDVNLGLNELNKRSFQYIIDKLNCFEMIKKLNHVMYTKLFKCVGFDPTIMKTIALRSTMTNNDFILLLYDMTLSVLAIIYDMVRNPITFVVTSSDHVMVWRFRALYQKAISYKDTGELFGKSMVSTNLPDKIISDKIYEYVQNYVSKRNKENGIIIDDSNDEIIDRHFHNFFVLPIYCKLFNIKRNDDYNTFQKINIQLFLYYTMKDFMEKTGETLFPKVPEEKVIRDKFNFEDHKILEILKRIPITVENRYKINQKSIFEDEEFLLDSSLRTNDRYTGFQYNNTYKIESLVEILTSGFKFYGINNSLILNNYLKSVMNVISSLSFKNIFTFDLTKEEFKSKKYNKQLELEIFPFLMVILDNKMGFYDKYNEYISNMYCIRN